jgi:hypothetical protein
MSRELSDLEKKKILKENHHKKIDYALAKAFLNDFDVYNLVQDFFAEFLNLKYKFTHEELVKELDKLFLEDRLKSKIINFLEKLSFIEFNSDREPTQEELKTLILEFKEIINLLIIFEEESRKGLFKKIKVFFKNLSSKKAEKTETPKQEVQNEVPPPDIKARQLQQASVTPTAKPPVSQPMPQNPQQVQRQQTPPQQQVRPIPAEITSSIDQKDQLTTRPLYNVSYLIHQINLHIDARKIPQARVFYKHLLGIYRNATLENKRKLYPIVEDFHKKLS